MEEAQENKLYVGNISYDLDDSGLAAIFSEVEGVEVTDAKVISDKFTGRSKGFGFVTMATPEMAQAAITALNGKEIGGRQITINVARPMVKRDDRGGGDRSYGRPRR